MAAVLTPGLTPFQRQQVADVLTRVGIVPRGLLASLFLDVDRAAARVLNPNWPMGIDCRVVAAELSVAHSVDRVIIGFAFGLAIGIRQGRTFAPPPRRHSKWISDEYKRLSEHNRRDVQRYIRKLLKAQDPPKPKAPKAEVELAAAKRWMQEAGQLARRKAKGDEQ
jgi:hypothetical protein